MKRQIRVYKNHALQFAFLGEFEIPYSGGMLCLHDPDGVVRHVFAAGAWDRVEVKDLTADQLDPHGAVPAPVADPFKQP